MKAPAFQFYAADFLVGTAAMTNEEVGIYIRLLCHQWDRGLVPKDKAARIVGAKKIPADVLAKFVDTDGELRNERLEAVRKEQQDYHEKKSLSGKAGAAARWDRSRDVIRHANTNGEPMALPSVCQSQNDNPSVLNIAHEWGLIARVPRIRFLKESQKFPTYMPSDHFAAIYTACNVAQEPSAVPNVAAADWWRALLVTAYMTGWRIGQLVSLKWSDIDFEANTVITRAEVVGNKGKREERIPLHPVVVEHLKRLSGSFSTHVFPWNQDLRQLWPVFHSIQEAARLADGSPMPKCGKNSWYGFHDLRRGFATMNAESLDLFELQALMQHKSLKTTQGYVSMAKRLQKPVNNLFVPSIPQISETA